MSERAIGERHPREKARSPWQEFQWPVELAAQLEDAGAKVVGSWQRNVSDGWLIALVTINPPGPEGGWHLSISFRDHKGRLSRYPRWDEITSARYCFCPDDLVMCMLLPPPDEYISLHDTTFQLHEHREAG
jgi:hypothetical protein